MRRSGGCLSCHLQSQTLSLAEAELGLGSAGWTQRAQASGVTDAFPDVTQVWTPIAEAIAPRDKDQIDNLRNFGYGPGMILGVSQRELNEIEVVRQFVATFLAPANQRRPPPGHGCCQARPEKRAESAIFG